MTDAPEQPVGHTAGEWTINDVRDVDGGFLVCGGEGQIFGLIATVTTEQDARLIAAAPRMFDYIAVNAAMGDAEAIQIMESLNANS